MKPLRIGAGLKPSREREGLKRPVENIEKIPINSNCTHGAGQSNQSRPSEAPQTIPALAAPSARPVAKASWCALGLFYGGMTTLEDHPSWSGARSSTG